MHDWTLNWIDLYGFFVWFICYYALAACVFNLILYLLLLLLPLNLSRQSLHSHFIRPCILSILIFSPNAMRYWFDILINSIFIERMQHIKSLTNNWFWCGTNYRPPSRSPLGFLNRKSARETEQMGESAKQSHKRLVYQTCDTGAMGAPTDKL